MVQILYGPSHMITDDIDYDQWEDDLAVDNWIDQAKETFHVEPDDTLDFTLEDQVRALWTNLTSLVASHNQLVRRVEELEKQRERSGEAAFDKQLEQQEPPHETQ